MTTFPFTTEQCRLALESLKRAHALVQPPVLDEKGRLRAHALVQPPVLDEKGRPDKKDRTSCMCVVPSSAVAVAIESLQRQEPSP